MKSSLLLHTRDLTLLVVLVALFFSNVSFARASETTVNADVVATATLKAELIQRIKELQALLAARKTISLQQIGLQLTERSDERTNDRANIIPVDLKGFLDPVSFREALLEQIQNRIGQMASSTRNAHTFNLSSIRFSSRATTATDSVSLTAGDRSTTCASGDTEYAAGTSRSSIEVNGQTIMIADAAFVCTDGEWKIK